MTKVRRRAQTNEKTQPRKVSLTDREWQAIGLKADRKGVSRSRYIAEQTLRAGGPIASGEGTFDLIFAYREAARALESLTAAVSNSTDEIDVLLVMRRLDRLDRNLSLGLQLVGGKARTIGSDLP